MDINDINPDLLAIMERYEKIFDNTILFKLNSEDISYMQIDGNTFYSKEITKDSSKAFKYLMNIYKAREIVRECTDVRKLDKDTYNFIIKYHPSWISARLQSGFVRPNNGEIGIISNEILKTPAEWMSDLYKVFGINMKSTIKNMNTNSTMTESVFSSTIDNSQLNFGNFQEKDMHPDYLAFVMVVAVKNQTDEYNKMANNNQKLKFISYKLDKDKFPIIEIKGRNKITYSYDFRIPEKREECLEWLRQTANTMSRGNYSFTKFVDKPDNIAGKSLVKKHSNM